MGRLAFTTTLGRPADCPIEEAVAVRHHEKPGPYLRLCVIVLYPLITLIWRRRWFGIERIPARGPAIIALNHISYADPLVVARVLWEAGRLPRFLAKSSLFTMPIVGRVITGAGQIPVQRGSADANRSLDSAVQALRRGEIVLIYPEGTVTRDPQFWPMRAKTGVARLAMLAPEVPVIPVGQWGAQEFLDVYGKRLRPWPRKTVSVSVGQPMDRSSWPTDQPGSLLAVTDEIMRAVRSEVARLRGEPAPEAFYTPRREASDGDAEHSASNHGGAG